MMWFRFDMIDTNYFDEDTWDQEALCLITFLNEIYKGKIVFLDPYEDGIYDDYRNDGYSIEEFFEHVHIDAMDYLGFIKYCIDNDIILIGTIFWQMILLEIREKLELLRKDEIAIFQFTKRQWDHARKLELYMNNLEQSHSTLGSLIMKSINLGKEDLSAPYYY